MRRFISRLTPVFVTLGFVFGSFFLLALSSFTPDTYAEDSAQQSADSHFVTIYDQDTKLTVRTDAITVAEVLERAQVTVQDSDTVEPALDTIITSDNFYINIYRSRPVIVVDGAVRKQIMTASYDPRQIAATAGFTVYDGDKVEPVSSVESASNFLETGHTPTYQIIRHGGRTVTVEESIPFTEEIITDYTLADGETKVTQIGEDGRKVTQYQVNFVNGVEVSRQLISEQITVQPVSRIVAKGAKVSVSPGQETCASWARQAGVSEADLGVALQLIYRESGCRVNASNPSGAYGIPQALPGSKMASAGADWQTNPVTQIRWMISYVNGRYGGWSQAMNHWWSRGWY